MRPNTNNRNLTIQNLLCLITICIIQVSSVLANPIKTIAITQIVEHESLIQAKQGVIDALKEEKFEVGKNIKIIYRNAQGSIASSVAIAKEFHAKNPDVVVPISTASLQTVYNELKNSNIPIVFSSVTDPVAAGVISSVNEPKINVTGAVDSPPLEQEIELIKQILPKIKTIGLIYNSGESNSVKTIAAIKEVLEKNNINSIESSITTSSQIAQGFQRLVDKVDAVYIPSDNTVFAAMPKLVKLSIDHSVPVFSSDPDSVKQGVLGCVGYNQYEVGKAAGKLVAEVLRGKRIIKITKPRQPEIYFNQSTAKSLKIEIPKEVLGIKTKITG